MNNTEIVRELRKNPEYRDRQAAYRKRRSEKEQAYQRDWRKRPENWARTMLSGAKGRAKKFGLEFSISVEDIVIPERCPVLGVVLQPGCGQGGKSPHAPSLDRVDNSKGYVKGNVRVISNRANMLKRDATVEELEAIVNYIRSNS